MTYIIKKLRRFCGFAVGFVFFISGILKLIDPVGAGLVMDEYFSFLHIGFLSIISKLSGTLLALAESVLGAAMITGVWRKATATAALIFQGFFTLLTLLLVIFNPEMDCGCFGEAIHLTHAQTFLKNIILIILLAAAYIPLKDLGEPLSRKYVSFGIVTMSVAAFAIYSWISIPLMDFTAWKPGARLEAADPYAMEQESYEAVFVYEKDGKTERFTLENLPDSSWTFVSAETTPKNGDGQEGISLSLYDQNGTYHDPVAASGKVIVISVYDPGMSASRWARTADRIRSTAEAGFRPVLLAASSPELIDGHLDGVDEEDAEIILRHLYFSDYKTLITMNRSNGGATYFDDGRLICKWAFRNFPTRSALEETGSGNAVEASLRKNTGNDLAFQAFMLYATAVMLLL
jgi:hypothetical protein